MSPWDVLRTSRVLPTRFRDLSEAFGMSLGTFQDDSDHSQGDLKRFIPFRDNFVLPVITCLSHQQYRFHALQVHSRLRRLLNVGVKVELPGGILRHIPSGGPGGQMASHQVIVGGLIETLLWVVRLGLQGVCLVEASTLKR